MTGLRVASDIGGTFTDTVVIDESGGIGRFKVPTVPSDPAAGVLATLELAAADMGLPLRDLTKPNLLLLSRHRRSQRTRCWRAKSHARR